MRFVCREPWWVRLACVVLFLLPSVARTQQADFPSIFFPSPPPAHQWQLSVGLIQVTPPKELTEEARILAPAFDLHALYGLSPHFALDGRALSQVVQNHFSVGGRWMYPLGSFAVGAGLDVAYWVGFLNLEGFDSKAHGWMSYPSVTVGYNTGEVRLILKTEAILNLYHRSVVGDNGVTTSEDRVAGASFMFALEQPFWKSTELALGFRATYTKFDWMTWALFSTFDRFLFHPEIVIGFML